MTTRRTIRRSTSRIASRPIFPRRNRRRRRGVADGAAPAGIGAAATERGVPEPDPDIECVVTLQPVRPVSAGAIASGMHARIGKPLRWFGRRSAEAPWQLLKSDTAGEFTEIVACLLLADRAGAASKDLHRRVRAACRQRRVVGAGGLRAARCRARSGAGGGARPHLRRPRRADRPHRAEDAVTAMIPGTRLRGVAEAAGFRLVRQRPLRMAAGRDRRRPVLARQLSAGALHRGRAAHVASTPGVVFLLDVPRVADPVRVHSTR